MTKKILEKIYYAPLVTPTAVRWNLYATGGTSIVETITDFIVYTGVFEAYRIRSIDPC
jgi:hypothetical protein